VFHGAPTADFRTATMGGMNTIALPPRRTWITVLLYSLVILLVPAMGVFAVAIASWQALLSDSIWTIPLGLVIVLASIAMFQSHKLFDLILLSLVIVAVTAWLMTDSAIQDRMLGAVQALASLTGMMIGLLLVMVLALVLIHAARRTGRW
jgi:hypothetical protein